ncbi:MAG: SBBP repeat-containing protein, partial [Candidatus Auribacterota bacterium]|nr:SBBP repeat-containing protein [Candidatus Auribacterota bacterium]
MKIFLVTMGIVGTGLFLLSPLFAQDVTLQYSTYLGGAFNNDVGYDIDVDSTGCAYITGNTDSYDFPTVNPYQSSNGESTETFVKDIFVTKFSSTGSVLLFSTYLGGSDDDEGRGIAVDAGAAVYVTGFGWSENFPTVNPYQASLGSSSDPASYYDAYVTKLSSTGSTLLYSTYLGGVYADYGNGIVVDQLGCAYIGGRTFASEFPTVNPYQASHAGSWDSFVVKFSSTGSSLLYSTYMGGNDIDYANAIAIDSGGCAYVAGESESLSFPTVNPYQSTLTTGGSAAVVTKLGSTGSTLIYSTYLAGDGADYAYGIALDSEGSAYVTGQTQSTSGAILFPTTAFAFQTVSGGGQSDAFLTRFSPSGSTLLYSTYLGGDSTDVAYGVDVDQSLNAYIAGSTSSEDFPTANPYQSLTGGDLEGFITRFDSAGSAVLYSTYLGGAHSDSCRGMVLQSDAPGVAYVVGYTASSDFPTVNPYQDSLSVPAGSTVDAFVARLYYAGPAITPTPQITATPTPS